MKIQCKGEPWNLISISSVPNEVPDKTTFLKCRSSGCRKILPLVFSDVSLETYEKIKDITPNLKLFDRSQAIQIIHITKEIHRELRPSWVVVHCDSGVSRSGAVAYFIHDYAELDHEQFKRDNPAIISNYHVWKVLNDTLKELQIVPKCI
jgi:predicted protein tyrosine phosphatase